MSDYIFYPGCSMESSAKAYYESVMAVCKQLGIGLKEIDDWNCCGATEYFSLDLTPAYALIARNLALAEQQADGANEIIAPCSACYLNLAKTDHYMHDDKAFGKKINEALAAGDLHYTPGKLAVRLYWMLRTKTEYPAIARMESSSRVPLAGSRHTETVIERSPTRR